MRHAVVVLVFAIAAVPALGRSGEPPPATLSGRWTVVAPGGVIIDKFAIGFDGARAPGTVPGRLTWRGVNCGAQDEPIQASWDGSELRFGAVLEPNANTQRMNGQCPEDPTRWVGKRKAGERSFAGEGRVRNLVVTVTAAP